MGFSLNWFPSKPWILGIPVILVVSASVLTLVLVLIDTFIHRQLLCLSILCLVGVQFQCPKWFLFSPPLKLPSISLPSLLRFLKKRTLKHSIFFITLFLYAVHLSLSFSFLSFPLFLAILLLILNFYLISYFLRSELHCILYLKNYLENVLFVIAPIVSSADDED